MENSRETREFNVVGQSETKIFDDVSEEDAELYNGVEGTICEFVRVPSKKCASELQKFKWRTPRNLRFVVYCAFFAVLTLYSVHFFFEKNWLLTIFSFITAVFMLYILLYGHTIFTDAMEEDVKCQRTKICCKLAGDGIHLLVSGKHEMLPYSSVRRFGHNKKYLFLIFKNSSLCKNGVVLALHGDTEMGKIKKLFAK